MNTLYLETRTLKVPFRYISFLSWQHKLLVYVFISLRCLLPEAATRVELFFQKIVLKNFVNFIGKHLCWSLFLIKLQAWNLPHHNCYYSEAVVRTCSTKKRVLRSIAKFTRKHLCQSLFFNKVVGLKPASLLKSLAQVFSCEFCEISRNTFCYKTPLMAASDCC